jgi:hypothetical protein
MEFFAKLFTIVGMFACVLLAVALLAMLIFVLKLRSALRGAATELNNLNLQMAVPARVHLQRREKLHWLDEDAANRHLQPLWRLGFQDVGCFEIVEMPGVKLRALARPEETLWAIVYEHPIAGVWMDFVTRYADGERTIGSLTTSNAKQGDELEHRPGYDKIYAPELDADGLYERHRAARRTDVAWQPVVPENYPTEFEKAYADEMDWRYSKGGVSENELRAIAAKSGIEMSDDELQSLREANEMQAAHALTEVVRERFLEQTAMPAAEWERLRDRLVIIHERMTPTLVNDEFRTWIFEQDDASNFDEEAADQSAEPPYPSHLSARQGFDYLNSTLPAARRFEKIGEVTEPVAADIYRASETAINYED